jgi:outer membrane immunogenic protein
MKRLVGALVALAISPAVAWAADMAVKAPRIVPPAPVYDWTGGYVGLNAGWDWSRENVDTAFSCPVGVCSVNNATNILNIIAGSSGRLSADGFTGGGTAGYNWQTGGAVLGVETDFDYFRLRGSRAASIPSATTTSIFNPSTSLSTDWLFTLRGRAGWAVVPTFLLYATGGLAVTEARLANAYTTTNNPANLGAGTSSNSQTRAGWTVGGGLEWMLAHNWSVKAEYLYADFGSISNTTLVIDPFSPNANIFTTSIPLRVNIARAGINYHFGGPVVAKY